MKLLISGCLLGLKCRFDGKSKPLPEDVLQTLKENFDLIPVCPESMGGLTIPREPSEKLGNRFISRTGKDVTENYITGAEKTLKKAQDNGCTVALLKERSPSCGFGKIYDGSFTKTLISGNGAAADLLFKNGILIFGESQIPELLNL